jgi:uncharacterized protein YdaU (DUF1376 family)
VNYYEHHIGDYAAATAHLSLIEDAIYSRLLRRYYLTESPLPVAKDAVARLVGARSPEEVAAVESLLLEFFALADDGWHQKRCDADITRFREKQDKAKASAEKRWADVRSECERNANALPTQCEGNAPSHQSPVTSHQAPKKQRADGAGTRLPPEWTVPADWREWARGERPDLTPDREAAKFVDHWRAQPGTKGRRSDWQATWRNWIRNAFAPRANAPPAADKPSAAADLRGKTYDRTALDDLPPDLRAAALAELGND